jgi:hypothetical protein
MKENEPMLLFEDRMFVSFQCILPIPATGRFIMDLPGFRDA